jgi:hypothetical protein
VLRWPSTCYFLSSPGESQLSINCLRAANTFCCNEKFRKYATSRIHADCIYLLSISAMQGGGKKLCMDTVDIQHGWPNGQYFTVSLALERRVLLIKLIYKVRDRVSCNRTIFTANEDGWIGMVTGFLLWRRI